MQSDFNVVTEQVSNLASYWTTELLETNITVSVRKPDELIAQWEDSTHVGLIVFCVIVGIILLCVSFGPSMYYIIRERLIERDKKGK
jgi:hypothetical protein